MLVRARGGAGERRLWGYLSGSIDPDFGEMSPGFEQYS